MTFESASVISSASIMESRLAPSARTLRIVARTCSVPPIVSFDADRAVLTVMGQEDQLTAGSRRRALSRALRAGCDVVVDLSGLSFADSSLMVDLAVLARRLRLQGQALLLQGAQ